MCQLGLFGELGLFHLLLGSSLPVAEIFVNLLDDLIGVKVARQTDGGIVRHIPLLEVVLDVRDARILQVSLCSDGRLSTIGMCGEQFGHHRIVHLLIIVSQIDVILLVHSLQLGMETTDGHVLEAVSLYLQPRLHLVRRDVLDIAGPVVPGIGIGSLGTNHGHHLVVLVGNKVLGSQLRHRVNLVVGLAALLGISQCTVLLVASLNVSQQRSFSLRVGHTILVGSLEHQVLQIVCQACRLRRVVL